MSTPRRKRSRMPDSTVTGARRGRGSVACLESAGPAEAADGAGGAGGAEGEAEERAEDQEDLVFLCGVADAHAELVRGAVPDARVGIGPLEGNVAGKEQHRGDGEKADQ